MSEASSLVQYERMRAAVARCASIDEAAELRDKAAALAAYAKQRDDVELNVWMSEIKLRASRRMGELIRDIPTDPGGRPQNNPSQPRDEFPKDRAIADAGLSRPEAYRLQQLAGPREANAAKAATAATEGYLARSRMDKVPATMAGLQSAVREAVVSVMGPIPVRPQRPPPPPQPADRVEPVGNDFVDLVACVETLAGFRGLDMPAMTRKLPILNRKYLHLAREASATVRAWTTALEQSRDEAN